MADLRRALVAHSVDPSISDRLRRSLEQAPREELFATAIDNHLAALRKPRPERSGGTIPTGGHSPHRRPPDRVARCRPVRAASPRTANCSPNGSASRAPRSSQTGTSFADEFLSLEPGDVVVVLAYGRLQSHVRVLLDRCAALDVPAVLVTDTLGRKLGSAVHTTLECGRGTPGLFASHGATLILIESLVLAVAAGNRADAEQSLATLNDLRAELAGRRVDVDAG